MKLSNEVQSGGLVQGLNLGTCLTLGNWGQQNHIYYKKLLTGDGLLFLQFNIPFFS